MLGIFIMICITFTRINTSKKFIVWIQKVKKKLDYKKLRHIDDYKYSSEEKQEETKTDKDEFSKHISEKETDINE